MACPLTVGVQIGTLGWQDDRGHAAILEERIEGSHEFGVPVMEQRAFPQGDQPLVPAHDGVWSHHDRSHFQTSAAEGVGQHSEPVAFSVGLNQSTQDWYSEICQSTGRTGISGNCVYQSRVVRFSFC